jgi:large subunit ribosomal protein L10
MSKQVKKLLMDDMRKSFDGVRDVLVISVNGVDGIQNNQMRQALRQKNIRVQVVKNSLTKRLFGEMGLGPAAQFLEGPSAVAWGGQTIVDLAKEITDWSAKIKKLEIKGGATSGLPLTAAQVTALSKLPSREELVARVVMLALSPARRVASLLASPAGRIASQLKTKSEGAPESASAESASAEPDAAPAT